MGQLRLGKRIALIALAALAVLAPTAAAQSAPQRRAILVTGASPEKGLPFFAANAIPCLEGSYRASASGGTEGPELRVWFTREATVLNKAWKRSELSGGAVWALDRTTGLVLFVKAQAYSLFFELPADSPAWRAFIPAFERKFAVFFENAATDAELSFPAYVDY
jgi:hypothetical protein